MKRILFFGDSNTYGYDPADWTEGRYPREKRWTEIVTKAGTGRWQIIEEGLNGRKIPDVSYNRDRLLGLLRLSGEGGLFCVMLGTNDILSSESPDAKRAIRKMEQLLAFLTTQKSRKEILLLAPPLIAEEPIQDPLFEKFHEESIRMNQGFGELARRFGVRFADTSEWKIELCFDQVHFSESGHRIFADRMIKLLGESE